MAEKFRALLCIEQDSFPKTITAKKVKDEPPLGFIPPGFGKAQCNPLQLGELLPGASQRKQHFPLSVTDLFKPAGL